MNKLKDNWNKLLIDTYANTLELQGYTEQAEKVRKVERERIADDKDNNS